MGYRNYLIVAAAAIIGLGLVLPNWARFREKAQRVRCLENINMIYKAMTAWGLSPGQTNGFTDPGILVCPCTGHKPGSLTNVFEWTDYVINTNLNPVSDASDILIYCPPANHNNEGANALKANGSGLWYDKADFDRIMKRKRK